MREGDRNVVCQSTSVTLSACCAPQRSMLLPLLPVLQKTYDVYIICAAGAQAGRCRLRNLTCSWSMNTFLVALQAHSHVDGCDLSTLHLATPTQQLRRGLA